MSTKTKTKIPPAPRWDLDSIFPGGSASKEYEIFRREIKEDLAAFDREMKSLPQELSGSSRNAWADFLGRLQKLAARIRQASSFVHALVSQNVNDEKAHQIYGEADVYNSEIEKMMVAMEAFAKRQSDEEWKKLVESDQIGEAAFFFNEMREMARKKMDPELETLVTELAVNGFHSWNRLYDKIYGDLSAEFIEDGEAKKLSMGQINNKMASSDRAVRKQAFEKLEESWASAANATSMALNYLAGFRLSLYKNRKWDSFLFEPLFNSRISEATLNAMWSAVESAIPKLVPYIDAKKKLMKADKFYWYDQFAPVGASDRLYSFEESGKFVVDNIRPFSPEMAEFCEMALAKRWIEGEDRPGKAGGGYCTGFPVIGQSRIFMTYSGTFSELATLAHELGHAWHGWVLKEKPFFSRIYPMTLAETASIFNELLVKDAALDKTTDRQEKLMLLDQKLQDAHTLFCNIFARFLFDKAFYTERQKGLVSKTRLDELMVEAQKKAFAGMLDEEKGFHPLFWASKLHFYLTDAPFYNFPYTFGYLFATGVYTRAKKEGPSFAGKYKALLADTGKMNAEQVAMKHLGVDLTKQDYWNEAVATAVSDVKPFVDLVAELS